MANTHHTETETTPTTAEQIENLISATTNVEGSYAVLQTRGSEIFANQSGFSNLTPDQLSHMDAGMGTEWLNENDKTLPVHIYGLTAVISAESFGHVSSRVNNGEDGGWIRRDYVIEAHADHATSISVGQIVIGEGKIGYADNYGWQQLELSADGSQLSFTGVAL